MKLTRLLVPLMILVFGTTLLAPPALAGNKQRHRWEGVAIGVGAAILGHAIIQSHRAEPQHPVVYAPPQPIYRHYPGPGPRHGHWESRRIWVPPSYETVWNPGHYNPKGHWVPGHWITIQTTGGHWTHERVWVAARGKPYR